jgi:hypothetical protein
MDEIKLGMYKTKTGMKVNLISTINNNLWLRWPDKKISAWPIKYIKELTKINDVEVRDEQVL